jgi:hypothetical protein
VDYNLRELHSGVQVEGLHTRVYFKRDWIVKYILTVLRMGLYSEVAACCCPVTPTWSIGTRGGCIVEYLLRGLHSGIQSESCRAEYILRELHSGVYVDGAV